MADKRCENGHFIDESWDLCPYCPPVPSEGEIAVVRPSRFASAESHPEVPGNARQESRPEQRRPAAVAAAVVAPRLEAAPLESPPMERTVAAQKIDAQTKAKRYVVGWLIALNGAARGESFPVRIGRNILGRDRRSDLLINDDQASSHHADLVFRPEERRFILMDHNSTNGTYVNEIEIEPRRKLVARDIVRVGGQQFLFIPLCDEGFYWDEEGALK